MPEQTPDQSDRTENVFEMLWRKPPWLAGRYTIRAVIKGLLALSLVWGVIYCVMTDVEEARIAIIAGLAGSAVTHYFTKDEEANGSSH